MEFKETLRPDSGEIKNRIVNYWTKRSHEFGELREKEQASETRQAWLAEITQNMPQTGKLQNTPFLLVAIPPFTDKYYSTDSNIFLSSYIP